MPKAPNEYGFQLPADRQPELRYLGELDAEGYVIRLHELAAGDGPTFFESIRTMRDLYPLDPADVVWPRPDWRQDADGRGFTLLEMGCIHE